MKIEIIFFYHFIYATNLTIIEINVTFTVYILFLLLFFILYINYIFLITYYILIKISINELKCTFFKLIYYNF